MIDQQRVSDELTDLSEVDHGLSDWEIEFVESMYRRRQGMNTRQTKTARRHKP